MFNNSFSKPKKKTFFNYCVTELYHNSNFNDFRLALKCFIGNEDLTESDLDNLESLDWTKLSNKFELIAKQNYIIKDSAYNKNHYQNKNIIEVNNLLDKPKAA
tara:strand:+ start:766 stop:1074 length:309 start_codon:yes stop_codon:yes gene_type:complete